MTPADPVAVAAIVAAILEELGIRYVIGGSVASSLMGERRSTLDLDLMIACDAQSVRSLVRRLKRRSTSTNLMRYVQLQINRLSTPFIFRLP